MVTCDISARLGKLTGLRLRNGDIDVFEERRTLSLPNCWSDEALAQLRRACEIIDTKADDLAEVESYSGPLDGATRARMLAALITSDTPREIIDACAISINACREWHEIIREVALNAEITPNIAWLFAQVFRVHLPENPLARLNCPPNFALTINDALRRDAIITFNHEATIDNQHNCMVIDLDNPLLNHAVITLDFSAPETSVHIGAIPWLANARLACSAFAVIAAE